MPWVTGKRSQIQSGFTFLCCLAIEMWVVCIPHLALLRTEGTKTPHSGLFLRGALGGGVEQTGERWGPPTATEDLLISPPGCGRTAGSCSAAAVGSGVRSRAHFTCGWVRISIFSASTPHHGAALPAIPLAVYMRSFQTPGLSAVAC